MRPVDDTESAATRRTLRRLAAMAALLALGCAGARPAVGARFPYETGERVVVQGVVRDAQGAPLSDLHVTLEASRLGLGLYPPGERKLEVVTGTTRTSRQGEFGLELDWSRRFNHFELIVGVPVATAEGERLQELARLDVTRRFRQGSPVAVPVTLEDTAFLTTLRQFLASLSTPDEQRVYRQTGKPDRVDRTTFPDRVESAWWYFRAGKVYRFRDGRLERVEEFDPVEPL